MSLQTKCSMPKAQRAMRIELLKELTSISARKRRALRNRGARRDDHVKRQRVVTGCDDGDVMRAGRQFEVMKIATEFLNQARVGPIDVHLSAPRIDVELQ